ncbi:hypothetical protein ACWCOZ_18630 [Streptomyces sp. NPDC001840]
MEVKKVARYPGSPGRVKPVHHGGTPKSGGSGRPKGPPTVTSDGWEYDLGGGMGILPRFDGKRKETKAPKPGGKQPVPVEVVVQRAVERLELPEPIVHTSPDEDFVQVVHVPTWMWVDHRTWGPVSTSAAVDGVKVTATALPQKAVWSMGDGGEVVCLGPGTLYSDAYSPRASSPDCGYTYRQASLDAPGQAYTVSVRVIWDVEWHGGGQTGVVPGLVMFAERQLIVDEVQAVVTR